MKLCVAGAAGAFGVKHLEALAGVAVSKNGVELIDREFISAIRERREPDASVAQCLPAMRTLDRIERCLG